jgi:hypothetical protein
VIIILGLVVLVAAVIAGIAGVLGNAGSGHALAHPFAVLGYHVTGSAGALFLYGIVTGALGLLGLSLLLAGARRTLRRGGAERGALRQSRRETATVSQERDELLSQREAARADAASTPGNGLGNGASRSGPAALPCRRVIMPLPSAVLAGSLGSCSRLRRGSIAHVLPGHRLRHLHGRPQRASAADCGLFHASQNEKDTRQAGEGKESQHLFLRRGEQQITASAPSLLARQH